MSTPSEFPPPPEQPFVGHLIELRDRLLRAVVAVLLVFLGLFAFANDLYTILAEPLLRHMPVGTSMIATEVASPFLTPFKLTLVLSVFIAVPYLLFQAWGFIAPALYSKEKRLVFPLLLSSTILFYAGMAFAYFVVFPLVFGFLTGVVPDGVAVMTDISRYLDFVLKLFFAFGLAFEVPIATILVIWSGLTTREDLAKKRPYIIVAAFVIGMLLTPPDVISQTLLALPMWLLFEFGLIMSRFYKKSSDEDDVDDASSGDDDDPTPNNSGPSGSSADNADNDTVSSNPAAESKQHEAMLEATPNTDSPSGTVEEPVNHDDSPGSADHYSEGDEDYQESSDDEMEREFDRLEAEDEEKEDDNDNITAEQHPEFEPIEEERQRAADERAAAQASPNENDAENEPEKNDETQAELKKDKQPPAET